jgi:hypothetical protein
VTGLLHTAFLAAIFLGGPQVWLWLEVRRAPRVDEAERPVPW